MLCVILILSLFSSIYAQQCATTINCKNYGYFNTVTCTCSCFPNYNGVDCSNLVCSLSDPSTCVGLISSCGVDQISTYCPNSCGKCNPTTTTSTTSTTSSTSTTTSTTTTSTTTSTTSTTTTTCPPLSCQNGGVFSATTCQCQCLPLFTGNLCQTINCAGDYSFCTTMTATDCSVSIVKYSCPKLCGICPITTTTSTTTTSTTTTCAPLTCQNGGTFKSCKCNCMPLYTGNLCQTLDCTQSDPSICSMFASKCATDASTRALCPKTCKVLCV